MFKSILDLITFHNIGACILFLLYFPGKTVFQQKLRTSAGTRWDSMLTYLDNKQKNQHGSDCKGRGNEAEKRVAADEEGRSTK